MKMRINYTFPGYQTATSPPMNLVLRITDTNWVSVHCPINIDTAISNISSRFLMFCLAHTTLCPFIRLILLSAITISHLLILDILNHQVGLTKLIYLLQLTQTFVIFFPSSTYDRLPYSSKSCKSNMYTCWLVARFKAYKLHRLGSISTWSSCYTPRGWITWETALRGWQTDTTCRRREMDLPLETWNKVCINSWISRKGQETNGHAPLGTHYRIHK